MAVLCEVRAEAEQRVKCFVLFRAVVTNSLFPDGKTANAPTKAMRRFPYLLWVSGMQEAREREFVPGNFCRYFGTVSYTVRCSLLCGSALAYPGSSERVINHVCVACWVQNVAHHVAARGRVRGHLGASDAGVSVSPGCLRGRRCTAERRLA